MQRFFNIPFPLDDPVISPLYTHVDTRASGKIYWSETDSPDVLSRAGGLVRTTFKNANNFVPTHVFLATWMDVGYYNERNDKASCCLYDCQISYVPDFLVKINLHIIIKVKKCCMSLNFKIVFKLNVPLSREIEKINTYNKLL